MHIIHQPDEPGLDCQYQQHGLHLITANSFSVPTFPNFRLGPIDGSDCDTLGIDNLPVAWWRSENDSSEALRVRFQDLSYFEPQSWSWDFGDGSPKESIRHPEHLFPGPGDYQVCLTVANNNADNTLCRTLHLSASGTVNPDIQNAVEVAPNPFNDQILIALNAPARSALFQLFDLAGKCVLSQNIGLGMTEIDTRTLPQGMYLWVIFQNGQRCRAGTTVKVGR